MYNIFFLVRKNFIYFYITYLCIYLFWTKLTEQAYLKNPSDYLKKKKELLFQKRLHIIFLILE